MERPYKKQKKKKPKNFRNTQLTPTRCIGKDPKKCNAIPGSLEKISILVHRAEKGYELFNDDEPTFSDIVYSEVPFYPASCFNPKARLH
jgi:hypothetical protein